LWGCDRPRLLISEAERGLWLAWRLCVRACVRASSGQNSGGAVHNKSRMDFQKEDRLRVATFLIFTAEVV